MHVYRYSRGSVIEWRQGSGAASGSGTGSAAPRLKWQLYTSRCRAFAWYSRGSGGSAPALPSIVTEPYAGWDRSLLASTTIPSVLVIDPSTASVVLTLASQTTASDATLTIANAALTAGMPYLVVSFNAAGTARGIDLYTAA